MKTTLEVLTEARAEIEDVVNWTTGVLCDRWGKVCAAGAIGRVIGLSDDALRGDPYWSLSHHPAVKALAHATGIPKDHRPVTRIIAEVNDDGHHSTVLALFDRAIANEQAKAQEWIGVLPSTPDSDEPDAVNVRETVNA